MFNTIIRVAALFASISWCLPGHATDSQSETQPVPESPAPELDKKIKAKITTKDKQPTPTTKKHPAPSKKQTQPPKPIKVTPLSKEEREILANLELLLLLELLNDYELFAEDPK